MTPHVDPTRTIIRADVTLGGPMASDPQTAAALAQEVLQVLATDGLVLVDLSGITSLTTAFLNALLLDVMPVAQQKGAGAVRFKVANPLQQELLKRSSEGVKRRLQQPPA